MEYKLLALDIDGTIVDYGGQLSKRTKQAVLKANKRGVAVVLVTGRRLTTTLPLAQILQLNNPMVVHNGSVIFDPQKEQILWQKGIDLALSKKIVSKLDNQGLNYVIYTGESGGERVVAPLGSWNETEDLLGIYLQEQAEFVREIEITKGPMRISIVDKFEQVTQFYQYLLENYSEQLNCMLFNTVENIWAGIEIVPAKCNKGTGLTYLANLLDIPLSQTIAIGDNVNDLEMIGLAGLGIAMANAAERLKAKADFIAPAVTDDGVAQVIEEFIL